jgi:WhiB family redox-sensing transcriptional regulator
VTYLESLTKGSFEPKLPLVILPIFDHWEWQSEGACFKMSSDVFFHPEFERGDRRRIREKNAKSICAKCLVVDRCGSFALATKEAYGIWGGLSEEDRTQISS